MKKFYVVRTHTGKEKKVKEILERLIVEEEKQNLFGRIIIPMKKITRWYKKKTKKGEKKEENEYQMVEEERKFYPGYIVVEMEENDEEAIKLVTSVPGVAYFLGKKNKPTPLSPEEMKMIEEIEKEKDTSVPEIPFSPGDHVRVVKGPFAGFSGTVEEVYPDRRRIRMIVTIFGRMTPIEIDFFEVEKI
ncbi:MAG: transcription termination/antitermination protein NusG [candidate division WOR-3 bacterium]|nr:transcription termination/antitermination protein NusG [candidate division WOR-3 bacterium]MCX7837426.1 transcription termination/antitermination protein NusG [candidate division WOR-3 bacterium]MDW8114581.1 transcription termination/antitermination protein NusG [candidate division WOR-3 bacterium]